MKKTLMTSAAIVALSTSGAFANATLDSILASDTYAGATILETKVSIFRIKVEAELADGSILERTYSPEGVLRLLHPPLTLDEVRDLGSLGKLLRTRRRSCVGACRKSQCQSESEPPSESHSYRNAFHESHPSPRNQPRE